ncbi:hypothetical protein [Gordonia otitidis]|uniref:Uncharacterized protein n=1 Tax=Gordonia otitidis (strain DSM 44809 / CCUG 52243 / JCM 12355 / NBRC 100426 / IFM 10032) TaxID=1108044 RepID=H5TQQ0_GORO1|nr:hypothetical protein [Gordonia otitidis]UEA58538.1 hypothetical protein LK459_18535 [Gordonia otitidis]GAB35808.1 hypothetical protein GOOTI_183_00040 [Gordonia otitidis NBRC 100426]
MDSFLAWWDSVEEWLTGLSFVPQLLVTLVVVIPVAIGIALVLNVLVEAVMTVFDRRRFADDDGKGL